MKIVMGQRVFESNLFFIMGYMMLTTLLLCLGYWQLERAEEKKQLITQQQAQLNTVFSLSQTTSDKVAQQRYKTVQITGHYDTTQQILCDNQIVKGKAGYFVLTPFIVEGGKKAVLVNRGWLPANPNRKILPAIAMKQSPTLIIGRINAFPSVGIKLTNADRPSSTSPMVVQIINPALLAKKLGYPLFSFQVELDKNAPEGYAREWLRNTLMLPEQHIAYAVQWFGLAFTLSLLFFWNSIKKQTHD